jgi:molybdopterin converting factor small subunit
MENQPCVKRTSEMGFNVPGAKNDIIGLETMSVEINIPPSLQALVDGVVKINVTGGSVGECLHELVRRYPRLKEKIFTRNGRLPKGMNIFINGANAGPRPMDRAVRDNDKVHIAYIVLGG